MGEDYIIITYFFYGLHKQQNILIKNKDFAIIKVTKPI